jgi:glycosyltransferase involved in cell wall biosynthesis
LAHRADCATLFSADATIATPMDTPPDRRCRSLVAVPAYNEGATVRAVIDAVRTNLPDCDVLVVDDGSRDEAATALAGTGAVVATHLCNLGYGHAIQTAVLYATRHGYDRLITLDADGQHDPAQVRGLLTEFDCGRWDILIGSRYVVQRKYDGVPLGRRLGMQLFSTLVGLLAGQRIYDTTSGLKVIGRRAFVPLTRWHFIDFHAEALVYLMRLGFRIGEFPITVRERRHGPSMYSALSHVKYPLKTMFMLLLGVVHADLSRKRAS